METVNRSIKELSQFEEVIQFKENRLATIQARIKELEEKLGIFQ